jgi:hypothetical protein
MLSIFAAGAKWGVAAADVLKSPEDVADALVRYCKR